MRVLSLSLLFAGLCPALIAQGLQSETKFCSPWPETGTVAFERVEVGRIGEDHLLDPVVWRTLGSAGPVWQPNVHRINAAYQLGDGSARDVAVLPGVAPGQRDGLLLLTPAGLELHWAVTGQTLSQIAVHGGEDWQTAERLWVVQAQDGQYWICGLAGNQVLRLVWDGQAFATCTPLPAPQGLTSLQAVDFDGTGQFEVLMWSDPWLFVLDWAGTPIAYMSAIVEPGDALAPVAYRRSCTVSRGQRNGNAVDRDLIVVHLYRCTGTQGETTPQWWSFAVNSSVSAWTPLGDVAANHQAVVDMDGDGRQDVLLARSDRAEVCVLYRTGDASLFHVTGGSSATLIVPNGENDAGLDCCVAGDFDGDGDADFIAYQGLRSRKHLFYGNVVTGRRTRMDSSPGVPVEPGQLSVQVHRPPAWAEMLAEPVGGDLKVQIEGWVQPTSTAPLEYARRIFACEPATFTQYSSVVSMNLVYDPAGMTAGEYVLQLHVSIVRMIGATVTQRYPSSLTFSTPRLIYRQYLEQVTAWQAANGGGGKPGDGDGSVDGNDGNKPSTPPLIP